MAAASVVAQALVRTWAWRCSSPRAKRPGRVRFRALCAIGLLPGPVSIAAVPRNVCRRRERRLGQCRVSDQRRDAKTKEIGSRTPGFERSLLARHRHIGIVGPGFGPEHLERARHRDASGLAGHRHAHASLNPSLFASAVTFALPALPSALCSGGKIALSSSWTCASTAARKSLTCPRNAGDALSAMSSS